MGNIAITADGLSKRYRIGSKKAHHDTLRDKIVDSVRAPLRRLGRLSGKDGADQEMIWALKDVSFEVQRGEVLGIIGRNGAGKSTLLKILSRITRPTSGRAKIYGRVGSLLEVGTGFHPELTGRENIFLNGAVLGMRKAEIKERFDEIVDFSGIEQFLDTPVKRYSSGMYVRLAFAVAAHLEPEILLVDEVLAVGDAEFQRKCLGKMEHVAQGGRTVLFVSHSMEAIQRLCKECLWVGGGGIVARGESTEVVSQYLNGSTPEAGLVEWPSGTANPYVKELRLMAIATRDQRGLQRSVFLGSEPISIELDYVVLEQLPYLRAGFVLLSPGGTWIFEAYDSDSDPKPLPRYPGRYVARCRIPGGLLNTGRYILTVNIGMPGIKNLVLLPGVTSFRIEHDPLTDSLMNVARRGVIKPSLAWDRRDLENDPD